MDTHDHEARVRAAMDELHAALNRAQAFLAEEEGSAERRLPLAQQPAAFERARRLAAYATKPLQTLVQVDVWQHGAPGDPSVVPDEDGDCLLSSITNDFRNFDGVRVQFPPGRSREDIIRALDKVMHWIESGADIGEDRQSYEIPSPTKHVVNELSNALQYEKELTAAIGGDRLY